MVGKVRFEARVQELVENIPDLAVLVEPLHIIIRRLATSERTMTPAMASKRLRRDFTTKADRSNTELAIICQPRSHRLHNPDQFRRGERYRFAGSGPKGT
jgi:hypothetical protein